ncbi:ribosomal maturation YjgA family protein [Adhaeretor mobilis]|uniref:DUF2809 domain-containing protein n=1 Tax=Adhaeretor mobilis TaxID=1930276 RepID=A0A517MTZ9_9BACT|nr:DUF2809 domain-containing protein [Adhaeretor mobilis]QDS98354.1 hypothetical protein HG15A2_16280 [Adhaeretor mobilis]
MPTWKRRLAYLIATLIVVTLGLASRHFGSSLPTLLADYAGDSLWALMVFFLVSCLWPCRQIALRAAVALSFAFLIEASQLYHAPWIDSLRATRLGGLVLGFGFLWSDLACYTVGVVFGAIVDHWITTQGVRPLTKH